MVHTTKTPNYSPNYSSNQDWIEHSLQDPEAYRHDHFIINEVLDAITLIRLDQKLSGNPNNEITEQIFIALCGCQSCRHFNNQKSYYWECAFGDTTKILCDWTWDWVLTHSTLWEESLTLNTKED